MSVAARVRRLRPRSLGGRLTLANVLILAFGLVVAAAVSIVVTYTLLVGEADDEVRHRRDALRDGRITAASVSQFCRFVALADATSPHASYVDTFTAQPFVLLDSSGEPRAACPFFDALHGKERQALVSSLGDPAALADSVDVVTVNADGTRYRVAVARLDDGSLAVTGTPIDDVRKTVHKLLLVEAALSATLLIALAIGSRHGARRQLRPLADMVETSTAISEGDLFRRVPDSPSDSDSSEVEQLRKALNAMLHQLEVALRTREHATAQLRQFIADASHELRTPLATMRGYLQLYDKGMLDDAEQQRALGRVADEAERMRRLVDELLSLARLDQHPVHDRTPVDMAVLARDAAADLRAQQPQRPVTVDTDGQAQVLADEAQLRQVLGNLLSNVRTHTPPDADVRITVRTEEGQAVLRVADEGPGMREQDAGRIFDRFFRADPDRARVPGGSGLGMSIVQAIVHVHGGEVLLGTAPGEGLTVTVLLPLRSRQV